MRLLNETAILFLGINVTHVLVSSCLSDCNAYDIGLQFTGGGSREWKQNDIQTTKCNTESEVWAQHCKIQTFKQPKLWMVKSLHECRLCEKLTCVVCYLVILCMYQVSVPGSEYIKHSYKWYMFACRRMFLHH